MKKIEHKFKDVDILSAIIWDNELELLISCGAVSKIIQLPLPDLEALAKEMGKRLVDDIPIKVYPEYNGWVEEE